MTSLFSKSFNLKPNYSIKRIESLFLYLNKRNFCNTSPRLVQETRNFRDFLDFEELNEDKDNKSKPYASRRSWSNEDTEKLIKLVDKYGNKWKVFTSYFPGRTSFCIRSHYFSVKHDTTRWTLEEKKILQKLLSHQSEPDKIDWELVRESLPKKRTVGRIKQFYQNSIQPTLNKGSWTKEESEQLMKLTEKYGKDWTKISKKMRTRSEEQCRNKYMYEINTLKKGEFTKEEDEALIKGVEKYGVDSFKLIKEETNSKRSVSQLKTRYTNFLDPTVDKSPWTSEEKELLFELYSSIKNLKQVKIKMNSNRGIRDMYNQLRSNRN